MFLLSFPLGKGDPLGIIVQRREVMCDCMLLRAMLCSEGKCITLAVFINAMNNSIVYLE